VPPFAKSLWCLLLFLGIILLFGMKIDITVIYYYCYYYYLLLLLIMLLCTMINHANPALSMTMGRR